MIDASAAEWTGTSDEIADAGAVLPGKHAGFITGTNLLIDINRITSSQLLAVLLKAAARFLLPKKQCRAAYVLSPALSWQSERQDEDRYWF